MLMKMRYPIGTDWEILVFLALPWPAADRVPGSRLA